MVVNERRSDAPWAGFFGAYLILAAVIVVLRVGLRVLFGGDFGTHVVFVLPELPLPDWMAGLGIGGPVTLESILAAFYDGLRLATLILCLGAANVLADARRLLRIVPNALYEIGATLVVALTVAPQLVESMLRVRRARRIRGGSTKGFRALVGLFMPVLQDALDRSLSLAAAMDARGYGRTADVPVKTRRMTSALVLAGLGAICIGLYGVLDGTSPVWLGLPMLALGVAAGAAGMWLGGRRIRRTAYRPDVWRLPETVVAATGLTSALLMIAAGQLDPAALHPSLVPLAWPEFVPLATAGILIAVLPAWVAPPVRLAVRVPGDAATVASRPGAPVS